MQIYKFDKYSINVNINSIYNIIILFNR